MAADIDETERRGLLAGNVGKIMDGCNSLVSGDLAGFLPGQGLEVLGRYGDGPVAEIS